MSINLSDWLSHLLGARLLARYEFGITLQRSPLFYFQGSWQESVSGIRTKPSPDCFFLLLHLYQPQQPRWRFACDLRCRDRSVQPFVYLPGAFVPWTVQVQAQALIGLTDAIRSRPAGLPTFRLSASCLSVVVSNLSDLHIPTFRLATSTLLALYLRTK